MAYSVNQLTTAAQCDAVLALLTEARETLDLQQRVLDKRRDNLSEGATETSAGLSGITSEITAITDLIATLPEGPTRSGYERRKRGLERRQSQLQDRQLDFNPVALIDREFDVACLTASLAEATALEAAVRARKATL